MRPGILHPGRQRDCFSFDQLRARNIEVREVGPHICIKRDLPGRLLGESQSGRGDATGGERQEGSAVEHDTPPWIDLPSILKQPGYPVVPTAAAILLAAQLFCQAAKMAVHAGAADCRSMMSPWVSWLRRKEDQGWSGSGRDSRFANSKSDITRGPRRV
jgi:hypothetical protein